MRASAVNDENMYWQVADSNEKREERRQHIADSRKHSTRASAMKIEGVYKQVRDSRGQKEESRT
jgi:hypothetical protein